MCHAKYKLDFSVMGFDEQTSSEEEDGSINSRSSGTEIFRSPFASTPPKDNPFGDSACLVNDSTQILKLGED